jgi:N-acetyl-gamma-glutamyl-phosphate reductase
MSTKHKVAIIGSTGYSGAEILKILLSHPQVEITALMTANVERKEAKPQKYSEAVPSFHHRCEMEIEPLNLEKLLQRDVELVFLPTPNETAHALVPPLLARKLKVVDLSGAYRLKEAALYAKWYGFEHLHAALLREAVYGLTEINRNQIRNSRILANPGCYPTSMLLPLIPLMRHGIVDSSTSIICDSKSGVSGAGKTPTAGTHFSEVTESFKAYNVLKHRHAPEIWQELGNSNLIFTPHLLPINRGIFSTIYVKTVVDICEADIAECYLQAYGKEPLIRLYPAGNLPEIKYVAHSNYCDLGWEYDRDHRILILISALDNLGKGAAGQAVQNMNVMLGIEETTGLLN